ncbi:uncharacterized protein LOC111483930 [Cucurbita maxima]|uniref:Uncharacterized protein LOC111483930 n=1 Tax=Cucurbita maxima TaxID=3661 RepID=A0A6J1JFF5_CUCMA|nr:uncharacterized protein LOC111483930 [Cucurbita maxima]
MAAEVSSLVRVLTSYNKAAAGNDSGTEKLTTLITRDLLSGGESQELDLDLHVPSGWEKRLDLKSGKMFIQRCNVQDFNNNHQTNQTVPKLQDLNFPPSPPNYSKFHFSTHLMDEANLDLKLVSSPSQSPWQTTNYQSVCTLDKVKSALERAERNPIRKRSSLWKSSPSVSPSPSYSSSSSSAAAKEFQEEPNLKHLSSTPIVAGCPGCLSYVLVMKNNPTCPRCSSVVPLPAAKKPRIDLNISI